MAATEKSVIVHANVFDPTGFRLFKGKASDRAECQTISCSNESCPLLKRGQCAIRGGLFGTRCPYGSKRVESGPTKRASSFYSWIRERKEQYKDVPFLNPPESKLAFIGEYAYLPYAHMTMCESVPFKVKSSGFSNGDPFLPRHEWTVDHVITLLQFRPRAMFGGEIVSYQKEEVPKFIVHLREVDPAMWSQLIEKMPHLDVAPNHVGRKAILATLKAPLEWTEKSEYPVTWKWDGTTLTTTSHNAFKDTWGKIKAESVVIHVVPKDRSSVVVQSNDWVNENTEFVD